MKKIELLAPAKNLEIGREAVNHGADALYVGALAFGARVAATNTIADIEELVNYAHLFGCKVFVTVNTILYDNELEDAVAMIRQLYNVGVDALIIQDMGLLECDLPPIELHASTQCHNTTPERVKFLEQVGFSRVILAREMSLEQISAIRQSTSVELESFVHGALCVSYSGQCYMSQYLTNRSGNRGCCSQPCRSSYDLYTSDGRLLVKDRHLLSLKDFNASQHIDSMIKAGITSFKIEGRLKDMSYVKNITAYYRRLLDTLMEQPEDILAPPAKKSFSTPTAKVFCDTTEQPEEDQLARASSGKCTFKFTPDVERTFNRGYTDYFLRKRKPMASFATQKSIGKEIGKVTTIGSYTLTVSGDEPMANGDGLCYFDSDGHLQGFQVNEVNGRTIKPNVMPAIKSGTTLWRNNDMQFEKQLNARSAERLIDVEMILCATRRGFSLDLIDEDGVTATAHIKSEHTIAENQLKMTNTVVKQLMKLGNTPYRAIKILDATEGMYFVPSLTLNELRRNAVKILTDYRIKHFRPVDHVRTEQQPSCPETTLDYRANVVNSKAEEFYKKHGISILERGVEQTGDYAGKALMTTKYCLRYELGCCLQGKCQTESTVDIAPSDTLILCNNNRRFRLHFDCDECQMQIFAEK